MVDYHRLIELDAETAAGRDHVAQRDRVIDRVSTSLTDVFDLLVDLRIFGSDLRVTWH
jgi:hypothetical protein